MPPSENQCSFHIESVSSGSGQQPSLNGDKPSFVPPPPALGLNGHIDGQLKGWRETLNDDDFAVLALRNLIFDICNQNGGGHGGSAIGMAAIGVALYKHVMRYNPNNPSWFDRDRFVLSNGKELELSGVYSCTGADKTVKATPPCFFTHSIIWLDMTTFPWTRSEDMEVPKQTATRQFATRTLKSKFLEWKSRQAPWAKASPMPSASPSLPNISRRATINQDLM